MEEKEIVVQMQIENQKLRDEIARLEKEKRDLAMILTQAEMEVKRLRDWSAKVKDYLRKVLSSYKKQAQKAESKIAELNGQNKLLRRNLEEGRAFIKRLITRVESLRVPAEKFEKIRKIYVDGSVEGLSSGGSLFQEIKKLVISVEKPVGDGKK
jgi:chromosome segregation ATPase